MLQGSDLGGLKTSLAVMSRADCTQAGIETLLPECCPDPGDQVVANMMRLDSRPTWKEGRWRGTEVGFWPEQLKGSFC